MGDPDFTYMAGSSLQVEGCDVGIRHTSPNHACLHPKGAVKQRRAAITDTPPDPTVPLTTQLLVLAFGLGLGVSFWGRLADAHSDRVRMRLEQLQRILQCL